jgi:hypothetical protein
MVFVVIYLLLTTTFLPWETFVSTALNVYQVSTLILTVGRLPESEWDMRGTGSESLFAVIYTAPSLYPIAK